MIAVAPSWTLSGRTPHPTIQRDPRQATEFDKSKAWHKMNGTLRYGLAHGLSGAMPYYIVTEYPKSGGTWLAQMLSHALGIPFPRNRFPVFRPSILHGHYFRPGLLRNVVMIWRDPRDVLVSQYYHYLFPNEWGNSLLVRESRAALGLTDYDDIRANLPAFINYVYSGRGNPRHTWAEYVDIWYPRERAVHTKYEELRAQPEAELTRVVASLTGRKPDPAAIRQAVETYSFELQAGRKPGQEDKSSFLRKGIVGDWKNHFTDEARVALKRHADRQIVRLGYEKDENW